MIKGFPTILSTVNAPYRRHLDEAELHRCLLDEKYAKEQRYIGQVWDFFGGVPVADQLAFAEHYSISAAQLVKIAQKYADLFGTDFPILHKFD